MQKMIDNTDHLMNEIDAYNDAEKYLELEISMKSVERICLEKLQCLKDNSLNQRSVKGLINEHFPNTKGLNKKRLEVYFLDWIESNQQIIYPAPITVIELQAEVKSLKDDLRNATTTLNAGVYDHGEFQDLQEQVGVLESENNLIKQRYEELQRKCGKDFQEGVADIRQLRDDVSQLTSENAQLNDLLLTCREVEQSLTEHNANLNKRIAEYKVVEDAYSKEIDELQRQNMALAEEIDGLKVDVKRLEKQITKAEKQ
jgi:chromosome segregation ATPase